jgi:hypothetical protein
MEDMQMNYFQSEIHHEAVPQKVKDMLRGRRFEEAILTAINFYQEYDMIESLKHILFDVSNDNSLTADNRISIFNHLLEIVALFYPTSTVGKMGKTNILCLLTVEAEKISNETALRCCRHMVSSLFSLFTVKKIGKEERASIFREIIRVFKRLKLYCKKSDSIIDPITNSLIEKLRIEHELPKGLLLSRKPFVID